MRAPVIGDAGDHDGGAEAIGRCHGPGCQIAAIAGAGDADAARIGEALGDAVIDARQDVLELGPAGIADIEPREILTPAGIAAIIRQEDGIARGGIGQSEAGIEAMLGGPGRPAMDVADHGQGPGLATRCGSRTKPSMASPPAPGQEIARTSG